MERFAYKYVYMETQIPRYVQYTDDLSAIHSLAHEMRVRKRTKKKANTNHSIGNCLQSTVLQARKNIE